MTKGEIETIRNIVERLKKPDCGCSHGNLTAKAAEALPRAEGSAHRIELVSRIYLDTWIIGALECLLPEARDVDLAVSLSR